MLLRVESSGPAPLFPVSYTHLDDLGSMPIAEKMDHYHPGWILAWSSDTAAFQDPTLAEQFIITPAGRFPAMDNPARDALLLYSVRYR